MTRDYGFDFNPFTEPQVPGVVRRLSDTRTIAIALGWFFGALGSLSLVHALWVGTRRRRVHLAMLRVLGMRRIQVLAAVVIQAVLLVTVAVVVGIPVGLVVGRTAWRIASEHLGAVTTPVMPWSVTATVFVAALVGATVRRLVAGVASRPPTACGRPARRVDATGMRDRRRRRRVRCGSPPDLRSELVDLSALEPLTMTCPRCGRETRQRTYGPCADCVSELPREVRRRRPRRRDRGLRPQDERHPQRRRHQGVAPPPPTSAPLSGLCPHTAQVRGR